MLTAYAESLALDGVKLTKLSVITYYALSLCKYVAICRVDYVAVGASRRLRLLGAVFQTFLCETCSMPANSETAARLDIWSWQRKVSDYDR